jgi:hypothetical protein
MANITRNFIAGKMNKSLDERLVPDGEYIDAMNIRMGSTENAEIGVIENTKGNESLTTLTYIDGTQLSANARCIGAYEDGEAETLYWFVHDPDFAVGATGKLDLIVSFNVLTGILLYHVISVDDGNGVNTTLNFNPQYLINGINLIKSGIPAENLLFFTDDYNPPRVINVSKGYAPPIGNTDQFSAEALLVIKKPPVAAPTIQLISASGQENYMENKFLCFAYRYRYADNEYSATSQFSEPAFVPSAFNFNIASFLNEGMVNAANTVDITYYSGDSLVVGVDLLFKEANSNVIKVIKKLDKSDMGMVDNAYYNYQFSNSEIFTVLPESEILRLYDNVPLQAKAQTIMGNRLMYGNYVEGYDLVDDNGNPVMFEYFTELITEEVGNDVLDSGTSNGTYNINGPQTIADSTLYFDLDGIDLVAGSSITIEFRFNHSTFTGTPPFPGETTYNVPLTFTFFLNTNYSSVYALATSTEFQEAIGTTANIQTVANACTGNTLTDEFNCAIPQTLGTLTKYQSGINAVNEPIGIDTSTSSTVIGLQLPAMRFVDSTTTPTVSVYEYYDIEFVQVTYQKIATPASLHSNRDYEIGIVYMDDFNRASTALVSQNNTVHVPCGNSALKNSIRVTIPFTQLPPYWATRYKFVIKPSNTFYETIYSSIYFADPDSNNVYFLLEGENAQKVEQGDRFVVKADSAGPTQSCTYATVLEKESKPADFLTINSQLDPSVQIAVPAGVYMKINPSTFNIVNDQLAVIAPGTVVETETDKGQYVVAAYPMNLQRTAGYDPLNPNWEYQDYTIPAGSRITLSFKFERIGAGAGEGNCEARTYIVEATMTSSADYDNMYDWFNGDNVANVIENGVGYAGGNNCIPDAVYIPTLSPTKSTTLSLCTNYFQFYRNYTTNELALIISGPPACTGIIGKEKRASKITATVQVFRAENLIVFETEPTEALPDVFYENNLSLPITGGYHMGNVPGGNQSASTPAIIDTEFFNCYSFGNGVESYKIRDSIVGKSFGLGNRVTSVSAQDYRRIDRFADITYSGVYYDESNVNKLNEFNLGLQNFKQCEDSFGPIQRLDARETDVLVLQEDKISYVLAGKNLLSDAGIGGSIAAIPEVLGTQIARTEKYGISFNPESYVHWGFNRFFTDVKRGAVIQLVGNSYSQDQLAVVSELGMRTWFRSTFIESFSTQKLGGWDPYMNEYVLTINEEDIPQPPQCVACGLQQTFTLSDNTINYCVDLSAFVGDVNIDYNVISIGVSDDFTIDATYNSSTVTTGPVSTSGTLTFNKNVNNVNQVEISLSANGDALISVLVNCPNQELMTIIQIVLTNDYDAGETNHVQFRYTEGSYTSPIQTSFVEFVSGSSVPLVSLYSSTTGAKGFGSIPVDNSNVFMLSNKIPPDTFDFDILNDNFRYYTSNTLYNNNQADILTLLGLSTNVTPIIQSGNIFQGSFNTGTLQDYLYLIWDYRASTAVDLCYSNIDIEDVCCNCTE